MLWGVTTRDRGAPGDSPDTAHRLSPVPKGLVFYQSPDEKPESPEADLRENFAPEKTGPSAEEGAC